MHRSVFTFIGITTKALHCVSLRNLFLSFMILTIWRIGLKFKLLIEMFAAPTMICDIFTIYSLDEIYKCYVIQNKKIIELM